MPVHLTTIKEVVTLHAPAKQKKHQRQDDN